MKSSEYENFRENKEHTKLFFPYNTYLCSIPLDFSDVPTHWHEEMELVVITKGQGNVTVDLEKRRVKAGDLVIVRPGQLHAISQDREYAMEYENIIFKPEILYSNMEDVCMTEFFRPYMEGREIYSGWIDGTKEYHNQMAECIKKIDELCKARPRGFQVGVKSYLWQFFFLLFSMEEPQKTTQADRKSLDKVKTIIKKIETDYAQPLNIETMACLLGFSQSHFMKFFKTHFQVSFVRYLNDYRLTMAARLLVSTSEDVLSIAMNTGFPNISYFNRLFKKKFHTTPARYRVQYKGGVGAKI